MYTSYQKLEVWQKAIQLCKEIYVITKKYPKTETYSLVDQMKRCSVSIASNIAEGDQRNGEGETIHFLYIAKGSAAELETQLIISKELGFVDDKEYEYLQSKILEVLKMLSSLITYKKKNRSS
ncbi:MAG: four helix bundle protein [candidate division SR1 bacterium CG_4_9_14_3_um_filter_40_9]|nr:MAG: four helix bundle protein [candidate division SR1 bacterium CG_4_9_14_3_um_filter_40_9]